MRSTRRIAIPCWLLANPCPSVPAFLVVGIVFVDQPALAVELHGAPLLLHVNLELAGGASALPAVIAVAHAVPAFAERKGGPAPRRHAHKHQTGQCSTQLREGVHALRAE